MATSSGLVDPAPDGEPIDRDVATDSAGYRMLVTHAREESQMARDARLPLVLP